jgi:hypothetical protein
MMFSSEQENADHEAHFFFEKKNKFETMHAHKDSKRPLCPTGNYQTYYSDRDASAEDSRLLNLRAEWFQGLKYGHNYCYLFINSLYVIHIYIHSYNNLTSGVWILDVTTATSQLR